MKLKESPGAGGTRAEHDEKVSAADGPSVSHGGEKVNRRPIPTIICERTPLGNFRFWCRHCRGYHLHGGGDGGGHRVSHCWSKAGQRAYPNGYYVVLPRANDGRGSAT